MFLYWLKYPKRWPVGAPRRGETMSAGPTFPGSAGEYGLIRLAARRFPPCWRIRQRVKQTFAFYSFRSHFPQPTVGVGVTYMSHGPAQAHRRLLEYYQ